MNKLILLILMSFPVTLFGQYEGSECEVFAEDVFNIIKCEEYEQLENYMLNIESRRKIMKWEKGTTSDSILNVIFQLEKEKIIDNFKLIRKNLTTSGYNFENAKYSFSKAKGDVLELHYDVHKNDVKPLIISIIRFGTNCFISLKVDSEFVSLDEGIVLKNDNTSTKISTSEEKKFLEAKQILISKCDIKIMDLEKLIFVRVIYNVEGEECVIIVNSDIDYRGTYVVNLTKKTCD